MLIHYKSQATHLFQKKAVFSGDEMSDDEEEIAAELDDELLEEDDE